MPQNLKPHILLFIVNLMYAANYTIAKIAMPGFISPEAFVVIRAGVGALTFLIIHAVWIREKIDLADWYRLILCGLTGVAINQMMFFKGLSLTSPINASLIQITVPIIVMIIASVALRERVTYPKLIGVISGLSGAAMIVLQGRNIRDLHVSYGDMFIMINATSYAIYLVMVKSLMVRYEALTVMRWIFFFGFIMVLPFGAFRIGEVDWQHLPAAAWGAIAYVLVCVTVLTYLFNAMALRIASATLVSSYIYLQPLLATLIAIGYGRDVLTRQKITAGILIFIGVYLVSFRQARPKVNLQISDI